MGSSPLFYSLSATEYPTATATATPTPQNGVARYYYDGDGNMVKSEIDDVTTYYPSAAYQVTANANGSIQSEVRLRQFLGKLPLKQETG